MMLTMRFLLFAVIFCSVAAPAAASLQERRLVRRHRRGLDRRVSQETLVEVTEQEDNSSSNSDKVKKDVPLVDKEDKLELELDKEDDNDKEDDTDKEDGEEEEKMPFLPDSRCESEDFRQDSMMKILDLDVLNIPVDGEEDPVNRVQPRPRPRTTAQTTDSPQLQAWKWLLDEDASMLEFCADTLRVTQRYVLAALFHSTSGDAWNHQGQWLTSEYECDWNRIICNDESIVTEIDLSRNGLAGTIPTELAMLTDLKVLSLWRNALHGTLPAYTTLTKLQTLDVEENFLTGKISLIDVISMPELKEFRVSYNMLRLSDEMTLNDTAISLPPLKEFWMSGTGLTGVIPENLLLIPTLQELLLDHNELTGTLPLALTQLSSLQKLQLHDNRLTGSVPSIGPGEWMELRTLTLHDNDLTGGMPASVCGLLNDEGEDATIDLTMPTSSLEVLTATCGGAMECDCCIECIDN